MYEVDNRDKTADLSALHGLLDKRQELSTQIEQMEQEKTAIEQQVKLQMQDTAYGTAPGYADCYKAARLNVA
jgi:predicted phage-related endonuclease